VSVQAITWARAQRFGTLLDRQLLLLLADNANLSGVCWPGIKRLSDEIGVHQKSLLRSLARLRAAGLIEILAKGNQYRGSTRYRLAVAPVTLTKTASRILRPALAASGSAGNPGDGVQVTGGRSAGNPGATLTVKNRPINRHSDRSVGTKGEIDPVIGSSARARGADPADPAFGGLGMDVGEYEGEQSSASDETPDAVAAFSGEQVETPWGERCDRPGCDGWCGGPKHQPQDTPDPQPPFVYQAVGAALGIRSKRYLTKLFAATAYVVGVKPAELVAAGRATADEWLVALSGDGLSSAAQPRRNASDGSIATGWLCKRVATIVLQRERRASALRTSAPAERAAAIAGGGHR